MTWETMPVTPAQVRAYLDVEGSTGKYNDELIGSNIRAAASFLERATGRQFYAQDATTKTFTTNGMGAIRIPDLRSASAINQQGVALTADETYWLLPDNRGSFTTVQFRAYGTGGRPSYLSNPEWFDRNLDRWGNVGSLPNDLTITGNWGYDPLPHDFLLAVKVLAAWHTKRPASVLANLQVTPEGAVLNYADYPPEVQNFITTWRIGSQLVAV